MLKKSYILNIIIDAKFKYKIKYLLFLSWDWEALCLTVWRVIPLPSPLPERNTAWNKGRKCFHCLGAPNKLIRPCVWLYATWKYREMLRSLDLGRNWTDSRRALLPKWSGAPSCCQTTRRRSPASLCYEEVGG